MDKDVKQDVPLEIQLLLAKAQLDRFQLKKACRQFQENLNVDTIKNNVVQAGAQAFTNILPSAPAVFDILQKYPSLSFSIAKTLLRIAGTKTGILKTLAIGVASWFIYNRFQKTDKNTSES